MISISHTARFMLIGMLILALFAAAVTSSYAEEEEANPETEETAPVYNTLSNGSKGDEVKLLQQRLAELGYYSGEIDGDFGQGTRSAVLSFQRRNGLGQDGIAGPKTQAVLFSDGAVPVPENIEPVDVLAGSLPYLINHEHPVDEYFVPSDLVDISGICPSDLVRIKYDGTKAVRTAVEALRNMLEAAADDGITKWQISAAYRSYSDQTSILNAKINSYLRKNEGWSRSKARSAALRSVAEPGHSEHHLGLAFDINVPGASAFLGTKQCTWLHQNCWDYGFIVRYQKGKESITGFTAEAWHIRYVGLEHALYMRDNDLCLEEYLEGIENGTITPPPRMIQEDVILDD